MFLMYFYACNSTVWVKIPWVKLMPQCSKRWVISPADDISIFVTFQAHRQDPVLNAWDSTHCPVGEQM